MTATSERRYPKPGELDWHPKGAVPMIMKILLVGVAVATLMQSNLAAEEVDRETIEALRRMAIEAGQTSSSAIKPPAKSQQKIEAERKSIEQHRKQFFTRAYPLRTYSETWQKTSVGMWALTLPSVSAEAPRPVDPATVQALRRMAIEAGQTSSSATKPPAKSPQEIETERTSLERHRVDFFDRAYSRKEKTGSN